MSPAEELLGTCLRTYPDRPLPAPTPDESFWRRAVEGGVALLVAEQLGARTPQLLGWRRAQTAVSLRVLSTLKRALAALAAAGVEAAPLKGPLLAERLYPDFTLRPTSDVDVLVARADLPRALEALARAGAAVPDAPARAWVEGHHHHVGVSLGGVLVEVHFRACSDFGVGLDSEPLLATGRRERVGGLEVLLLEPHHEALFLAAHAASHNLRRDVLLLDLRLHAQRYRLDLARLEALATRYRLRRSVGAALAAAGHRAGLALAGAPARWRLSGELGYALLPGDLHSGSSEDRAERLRGYLAQAVLTDSLGAFAGQLGERAWHGARRALRRRWPAWTPASWEA